MSYTIDVYIDSQLDEFTQHNIAPQCAWAADSARMEEYLQKLASFVLEQEGVTGDVEMSVSLVTTQRIHELNAQFRDIDRPTDVLSFPCDDPDEVEGQLVELGDIFISPEVTFAQAGDYGNTYVQELTLLATHGVLHLLGYDHMTDEEAAVMEAREDELVSMVKTDARLDHVEFTRHRGSDDR